MSNNSPVVQRNGLYMTGFEVAQSDLTTFLISAGICRDSTNNVDISLGFPNDFNGTRTPPIQLNFSVNGANGLDTGLLAPNTWYAIYIIGSSRNGKPTAAIATLATNSAPLLPVGYDVYRKRYFVGTKSDSSFFATDALFDGENVTVNFLEQVTFLSSGNSTSFVTLALNQKIPFASKVILNVGYEYTPASAGQALFLRPINNVTSNGQKYTGVVAAVNQSGQASVFATPLNPSSTDMVVEYKVDAGTLTLNLYGFTVVV